MSPVNLKSWPLSSKINLKDFAALTRNKLWEFHQKLSEFTKEQHHAQTVDIRATSVANKMTYNNPDGQEALGFFVMSFFCEILEVAPHHLWTAH